MGFAFQICFSGENSPVDKNGPSREQIPEDETGREKLVFKASFYFLGQPIFTIS